MFLYYEKSYLEIDTMDDLSADQLKERGDKNFSVKNYETSIEDYTKAIIKNPKFGRAYNNRGNSKLALGDFNGALSDYLEGTKVEPLLPHNFHNIGRAYFQLQEYKKSIDYFSKAIELKDNSLKSESYRLRGFCKINLNLSNEALDDLKKSLEIDPNNIESIGCIAYAKWQLGHVHESLIAANKAIRLDSECKIALLARGICRGELNKNYEAIVDLNKALSDFLIPIGFLARGTLWQELNNHEKAIDDFTSALNIEPKLFTAYFNRAESQIMIGEYEKALIDINKAIDFEKDDGDYFYRRGFIKTYLKQNKEAKKDFLKAEELGNRNATHVLSKKELTIKVLYDLEEEYNPEFKIYDEEDLIQEYENNIQRLKKHTAETIKNQDQNLIINLAKRYKDLHLDSPESFHILGFNPNKVPNWQYEAAAFLAINVSSQYHYKGKEECIRSLAKYLKDLKHPIYDSDNNYLLETFLPGSFFIALSDYLNKNEFDFSESKRELIINDIQNKAEKIANYNENEEYSKYATWLILEAYENTFKNIILAYVIKEKIKYDFYLVEIKDVSEKLKEVFYSHSLENLPEKSPIIDLEDFLERFKDIADWDFIADSILKSFENLEDTDLDIDQLDSITSEFYLKDFDDFNWELIEKEIFDKYPPKDISIEDSNPQFWPIFIPIDNSDVQYQSWESKYYADIYDDAYKLENIYSSINYLYDDDADKSIETVANDIRNKMYKTYDNEKYILNGVNKIIWEITQKNVNWEYVSENLFYYAGWPNNHTWRDYYQQNKGLLLAAQKGKVISICLIDNEDNREYLQDLGYVENKDFSEEIKIGEFFKTPSIFMEASDEIKENDFDCLNFYHIPNKNCCFSKEFVEESFEINKEKIISVEEITLDKVEEGFINSIPSFLPPEKVYINVQKGKNKSKKSWDNYYEKFKDKFNNGFRNIISLRKNDHVVFLLKELGYKENKLDKEGQMQISLDNIGDLKIGEYVCCEELSKFQGSSNNAIHILHRSFGGKNPFTLEDDDWWSDKKFLEKWLGLESNLILKIVETIDFDSMFEEETNDE
ncbi:Hypothetical protein P9215_04341 [Prochlorococcus marinus str. MIT 9215]|uniref:Uncharacterized protein n=1 Tax=Prochlorococcus marinus (strain MIT 9215) TaxID=93060 RepID=A8G369_PROM2|nr:tetratricopeptide repeat protein [Prochlorococcus marinus]ABV50050.1 Hypothetical protein P9215_04341 [Prochlorococcus marinus str. MIT 9215]